MRRRDGMVKHFASYCPAASKVLRRLSTLLSELGGVTAVELGLAILAHGLGATLDNISRYSIGILKR